jgi:hypothetical protein
MFNKSSSSSKSSSSKASSSGSAQRGFDPDADLSTSMETLHLKGSHQVFRSWASLFRPCPKRLAQFSLRAPEIHFPVSIAVFWSLTYSHASIISYQTPPFGPRWMSSLGWSPWNSASTSASSGTMLSLVRASVPLTCYYVSLFQFCLGINSSSGQRQKQIFCDFSFPMP